MTEFIIRTAGCAFSVCVNYDSTKQFCTSYLTEEEAEAAIVLTAEDIAFERVKSAREDELEGIPVRQFSDSYLETLALLRKVTNLLYQRNTLLFHGSAIAVDGQCYLFTAKSGTGKSTHTRLWRQLLGERAVMVNDDKPFLSISDEGVTVHGTPWNGKHGLGTNTSVPLKAICILQRGDQNEIHRIAAKDAAFMLLQQSQRPGSAALLPKYLELVDKLSQNTEFWLLRCNMNPDAAEVSFRAMSGTERN